MKQLLLGNEAVARGAWEAGVTVASAYPGTPSTEISEAIVRYSEVYAEWAPNEKVALEVGVGASLAGARTLVAMKHVGLNVAADPLFTASYTGINGGLVIVVADDPGMHSSQNEQDSRFYARFSLVPMLEPSDSDECLRFTKLAFEISEEYDTPVLVRLTTRVAHSRTLVSVADRQQVDLKPYRKDVAKNVMMPANARPRHVAVERQMDRLRAAQESLKLDTVVQHGSKRGIVTSGIAAQYVREALPDADIYRIGMVNPLPLDAIRRFSEGYEELIVVEELEPFIEDSLKAAGIACHGKELFGVQGELSTAKVAHKLAGAEPPQVVGQDLPVRPPVLCPGCPHRGAFHTFRRLGLTVMGDIGCYTLAASPPLDSLDTCLCMGASVGMAHGFEKARGRQEKVIAVLGDSTFIHSGITGLVNAVYNGSHITLVILDNATTGMTGHQDNPSTGRTLQGADATVLDLEGLCRSIGVQDVQVFDPYDLKASHAGLKHALAFDGPSVIILRRPCALLKSSAKAEPLQVDQALCTKCKSCMRIGCPAIALSDGVVSINPALCVGCGLCASVCPFGAIGKGDGK